jgi:hypothetical protein
VVVGFRAESLYIFNDKPQSAFMIKWLKGYLKILYMYIIWYLKRFLKIENFEFETYLDILSDKDRITLCKFRTCNHRLPIEIGRSCESQMLLCPLLSKTFFTKFNHVDWKPFLIIWQ